MARQGPEHPTLSSVLRHLIAWAQHATSGPAEHVEVTAARMTVHRSGDEERASTPSQG